MRTSNLVLSSTCGVALVVAVVTAWRGRRLPIVRPHAALPVTRRDVFRDATRTLANTLTAGLGAGFLVVGLGGRLVMRILAATSEDRVQGRLTEADEVIGEITFGGTVAFILFVGLLFPTLVALAYLLVRRLLPTRAGAAGVVLGLVALATLGVSDPLSSDNVDFELLTPRWLAVALVAAVALLFGVTFTAIAARLEARVGPFPRPPGEPARRPSATHLSLLLLVTPVVLVPSALYVGGRVLARGRVAAALERHAVRRGAPAVAVASVVFSLIVVGRTALELI